MRRTWLLPIAVGAIAGAMTLASAASLTVTSKDLTVLSVTATPSPTGDTTAPTAVGISTVNGGGTADLAESGDEIVFEFSEPLKPSTICSSWPSSDEDQGPLSGLTVTFVNGGQGNAPDKVTFSGCNIGELDLGHQNYVGGPGATFTNSSIAWSSGERTITVTLGTLSGSVSSVSANANRTFTPSSSLTDLAGNTATGSHSQPMKMF